MRPMRVAGAILGLLGYSIRHGVDGKPGLVVRDSQAGHVLAVCTTC
jgi:hypothetical protein